MATSVASGNSNSSLRIVNIGLLLVLGFLGYQSLFQGKRGPVSGGSTPTENLDVAKILEKLKEVQKQNDALLRERHASNKDADSVKVAASVPETPASARKPVKRAAPETEVGVEDAVNALTSRPQESKLKKTSKLWSKPTLRSDVFKQENLQRIALIGASGYIGAALDQHLRRKGGYWDVSGFDRNGRSGSEPFSSVVRRSAKEVKESALQKFAAVVYLGGVSGGGGAVYGSCESIPAATLRAEQVADVVQVAEQLQSHQLLLVPSLASLAEGYGRRQMGESDPVSVELLDKCQRAMLERENALVEASRRMGKKSPRIIILRLGAVVGVSPSQRADILHAELLRSSLVRGRSSVQFPGAFQPVLWMRDLLRSMEAVLHRWRVLEGLAKGDSRAHIFHVASYNARNGQAGSEVAQATQSPADWVDPTPAGMAERVGGSVNTSYFTSLFGVRMEGSPQAIVAELLQAPKTLLLARPLLTGAEPAGVTLAKLCKDDFKPDPTESKGCRATSEVKLQRCDSCGGRLSLNLPNQTTAEAKLLRDFAEALYQDLSLTSDSEVDNLRAVARLEAARTWINEALKEMYAQGHEIIAFGVDAQSLLVLNFLYAAPNRGYEIAYVIDNGGANAGRFVPGTALPIKRLAELSDFAGAVPLTCIVLDWTNIENVRRRLSAALALAQTKVPYYWLVTAFPLPQIHSVAGTNLEAFKTLATMHFRVPKDIAKPAEGPTVGMTTHYFNEALLIPYFVQHHAHLFDAATVIDMDSTDNGNELATDFAPSNWKVLRAPSGDFNCYKVDSEVVKAEMDLPTEWKIALTITEFVSHPNLRAELRSFDRTVEGTLLSQFRISDPDDVPPLQKWESLHKQRPFALRTHLPGDVAIGRWVHRLRELKNIQHGMTSSYHVGRHNLNLHPHPQVQSTAPISTEGLLSKFYFSPWPEVKARKLQIGNRIPKEHLNAGLGAQHNVDEAGLLQRRKKEFDTIGLIDLSTVYSAMNNPDRERELVRARNAWQATCGGGFSFLPTEAEKVRKISQRRNVTG